MRGLDMPLSNEEVRTFYQEMAAMGVHAGKLKVGLDADADLERIEDGWIVLGDTPGIGITFDEAKLAELAIDESAATMTALPAGRRRGAGLVEVGPAEPDEPDIE